MIKGKKGVRASAQKIAVKVVRRNALKPFTGIIVRKRNKKNSRFIYVEKSTGRRTSEKTWRNYKDYVAKRNGGFSPAKLIELASGSKKTGKHLEFYIQSMDSVFRKTLFQSKGKRIYVLDITGRHIRITKKNLHKFLLLQDQFRKDRIIEIQNAQKKKKVTTFPISIAGWISTENKNTLIFDYSMIDLSNL